MLADAFIKTFVTATDQGDVRVCGKLLGNRLIEQTSLRGEQNDRDGGRIILIGYSQHRFHRFENRFGFHYHPTAAAVGGIVGHMVFVVGIIADVMYPHIDQSPFTGAFENTGIKIGRKNFGQKGEHLKLHAAILA